ncbi:MAG: glycoside hydrolase [Prevotella sp.]|nr:glycoside hydrolase [Prevotella sp.]
MNKILCLLLFAVAGVASAEEIKIDVTAQGQPLNHYWSVGTCAGRVNEGLRTSWVEQLRTVHDECGFQYLRMHGLFDDDMCVYFEDRKGNPIYNWQYIDEVFDRMLQIGVRPFVELSFFPELIAKENSLRQMWYRNCVSYDAQRIPKWEGLVEAFTRHVVERYGLDEVRQWYFEVWNEPNLNFYPKAGFFDGTKSDYFNLYRLSARAVKSVDSQLRVGGPATSNFVPDNRYEGEVYDANKSRFYGQDQINKQQWKGAWIEEFLQFCAKEQLPVDFISCHPYPTDYALDPVAGKSKDAVRYMKALSDDMAWLRRTIAASAYPKAEIHLTEWSTSPSSRDPMHDNLPPAAFIVKGVLDNLDGSNSLMYWTFTDIFEEKGGGQTPFHGGFGMITFQGWKKPSFHAYRMLNQLGNQILNYSDPVCVTRDERTGRITALAFNYPDEYLQKVPSSANVRNYMQASAKQLDITLTGLPANAVFDLETLDDTHGNAIQAFRAIASPKAPTREQTRWMRQQSEATLHEVIRADADGQLRIQRELAPWTLVLIKQM